MKHPRKYRAWIKDKNKMIDVYDFARFIVPQSNDFQVIEYDGCGNFTRYHDFELMEVTGLKDKNGKEIYEGDLVRYIDGDKEIICPVRFIKKYACFGVEWGNGLSVTFEYLISFYAKPEELEVVGNIYENPELLEGV